MPPGSCSSSSRRSAALIMPMALLPLGGGIDEWPGVAGTFEHHRQVALLGDADQRRRLAQARHDALGDQQAFVEHEVQLAPCAACSSLAICTRAAQAADFLVVRRRPGRRSAAAGSRRPAASRSLPAARSGCPCRPRRRGPRRSRPCTSPANGGCLPLALRCPARSAPRPGAPSARSAWPWRRCRARCRAGCSRRPPRACSVACTLREPLLQVAHAACGTRSALAPGRRGCDDGLEADRARELARPRAFSSTASGGAGGTSQLARALAQRVDGHGGHQQQQQAERRRAGCA